jgi:single-strand DNA-binding protein
MATDETWLDQNNERQKRTEWHRIVVWGKLGETCAKYLAKGKQVYIEGRIQTREWTDKEGNKRYSTEIVANAMQMLSPMDSSETKELNDTGASPQETGGYDDIPF